MIIGSIIMYLGLAFIFYGYCFSYWTDEYPGTGIGSNWNNVAISVFFSLIWPFALLPSCLSRAWKYGWRLK